MGAFRCPLREPGQTQPPLEPLLPGRFRVARWRLVGFTSQQHQSRSATATGPPDSPGFVPHVVVDEIVYDDRWSPTLLK